ncbi:hypothetical protein SMICM17S_03777 [Streptomyces microflavus]
MEARQVQRGEHRMPVRCLARGAVHRVAAERPGRLGLGLPQGAGLLVPHGVGRRVQRGHQLQAGDGGRPAGRHYPHRVGAQDAGELRRRQLRGMAPEPGVQRVPGRNAQLHALAVRALGRTVDPRPRPEPPLGQLPVGAHQLLDDLVALRDPPGILLIRRQSGGEAVALQGGLGEDEQRVGRPSRAGQLRLPELRLRQGPLHQGGQGLRGHIQDQTTDAVRQHLAVLDVDDRQRTVLEPRIGTARRSTGRSRRLSRTGAARRRRPGGARRGVPGGRSVREIRNGNLRPHGHAHLLGCGSRLGGQLLRRSGHGGERGGNGGVRRGCRLSGRGQSDGVELCELVQQSGVGVAFRGAGLGLPGLPPGHSGPADLQRGGDFIDRQAVSGAQAFAFRRGRQGGAGRDQGVDRIEQLGQGTPPDHHSNPLNVRDAYVYRTNAVRCFGEVEVVPAREGLVISRREG